MLRAFSLAAAAIVLVFLAPTQGSVFAQNSLPEPHNGDKAVASAYQSTPSSCEIAAQLSASVQCLPDGLSFDLNGSEAVLRYEAQSQRSPTLVTRNFEPYQPLDGIRWAFDAVFDPTSAQHYKVGTFFGLPAGLSDEQLRETSRLVASRYAQIGVMTTGENRSAERFVGFDVVVQDGTDQSVEDAIFRVLSDYRDSDIASETTVGLILPTGDKRAAGAAWANFSDSASIPVAGSSQDAVRVFSGGIDSTFFAVQ